MISQSCIAPITQASHRCVYKNTFKHNYWIIYIYLTSITEIVTLFKEQFSSTSATLLIKNAGCFGGESWRASFESIETTSIMVGLSNEWSCTHKSLTWMHLNISDWGHDSCSITGSISSRTLPSFHNCHAWYKSICMHNVTYQVQNSMYNFKKR